jgi:hypothetical protein
VDPVLVEAEEVADLVEDRDPDLPLQLLGVAEGALERSAIDDDLIWKGTCVVATGPSPS